MSYKVRKLVVGKGRAVSHGQDGEWVREYYELELDIPDESELSIARENALGLLNEWLGLAEGTPRQKWSWNPEAISWEKTEGFKGPFEKSKDFNSPDFKAMVRDLASHNGRLTREGYFYWLFRNGSTVGRKKRGVSAESTQKA